MGKGVKLTLCFFFNLAPRHEDVLGELWYSSTHSLALTLDVSGQLHGLAALPPWKELQVPIG